MQKQPPQKYRVNRGAHLLEITCQPWLPASIAGEELLHITCRSIYPTDAPLSIAPTGFYQHTLAGAIVKAAGGPVEYIDIMLAAEGE